MPLVLLRELSSENNFHYWKQFTQFARGSVNFCETDYEYTQYIVEFFNTISSFAMSIVGGLGVIMHPWAELRFHTAFLATVLVGLGSVAFHGTMFQIGQWADEVPMLYSALSFVYIGVRQNVKLTPLQSNIIASYLVAHSTVTTLLVTLTTGPYQFTLFHISFGTAQFYAVFEAARTYYLRSQLIKQKKLKPNDPGVKLFEQGITMYLSAIACWITEMFFCEYINPDYRNTVLPFNPQLHSWWHILVSMGLYNMALLTLFASVDAKYGIGKAKIGALFGYIPYVLNPERQRSHRKAAQSTGLSKRDKEAKSSDAETPRSTMMLRQTRQRAERA